MASKYDRRRPALEHDSVHRQFIKTGLLDMKWGRLYDQLFEDRQEGDYVVFVSFEAEYVQTQLGQCSEFLNELRMFLPSTDERK